MQHTCRYLCLVVCVRHTRKNTTHRLCCTRAQSDCTAKQSPCSASDTCCPNSKCSIDAYNGQTSTTCHVGTCDVVCVITDGALALTYFPALTLHAHTTTIHTNNAPSPAQACGSNGDFCYPADTSYPDTCCAGLICTESGADFYCTVRTRASHPSHIISHPVHHPMPQHTKNPTHQTMVHHAPCARQEQDAACKLAFDACNTGECCAGLACGTNGYCETE